MKNGIKIIRLEGSDILKNNLDGVIINRDYIAVFPDSLLLDKLKGMRLNISKNDTTRDIIALNFKYGYTPKEIEDKNKEFLDNKKTIDDLIKQKKDFLNIRKEQPNNKAKKPYTDKIKSLTEEIKDLKNENKSLEEEIDNLNWKIDKVREYLYKNGFHLDFYKKDRESKEYKLDETIQYRFWFRSPSKSRTGNVLFINEKFFNIRDWQRMGIELSEENAKLVEMSAYEALTASHIENRIIINPDEILVVNDLDSYNKTMCAKVYYHVADPENNENDINDMCYVINGKSKVKNTIWDGMGLLSDELFKNNSGMMLLRQHFFKCCGFRTYISKFFKNWCIKNGKDYNTYTVKDRYGNDILVKNIKLICTENSMKWEKFDVSFNYWKNKIKEDNCIFGVCKTDHPSKYGEYQRLSYQMVNTLPIDSKKSIYLCDDTIQYVNSLKNNNDKFIDFLQRTKSTVNANEMVIDLYNRNYEFADSNFFRTFKTKTLSEYKETLRTGKLLVRGDNLTVCGNPYILLLHAVSEVPHDNNNILDEKYEDPTLPQRNEGYSVYTTRFQNKMALAMFRNPHNSPNNICYGVNHQTELMQKYFNFSKNIIAINMIHTDLQDRANGLDEDSDFMLVTSNYEAVMASREALKYATIVNCIDKDKRTYNNNMHDMALIDNELAKSKLTIGTSSNLAQKAMSWYWNSKNNNKDDSKELESVVAICSVLAQIAIDNSKRKYNIDIAEEVARIQKLSCVNRKNNGLTAIPYFFRFIKKVKQKQVDKKKYKNEKNYIDKIIEERQKKSEKENEILRKSINEEICPMDWIQDGIDKIKNNWTNKGTIKDINFVIDTIKGKANNKQIDKIEDLVKKLDDVFKEHNDKVAAGIENKDDGEFKVKSLIKTDETMEKINKMKIDEKTMQRIIVKTFSNENNEKYKRKLLNCLYHYKNKDGEQLFLNCFKMSEFGKQKVAQS
ncbi:hypothetical protein [Clostridium autoethanogenum]|uniref:hypothetical protein n=1 Tax=Clostridium autoethanogenum TaxID=84023 RepID=UPI0016055026|nr:hypothetical protein [Clostridium autoethanogenum]